MLTQTAEYALRAVLFVALHQGESPVRVDQISAALGIPRNYLSKVMHVLARTGVLRSSRGPRGGFVLALPAEEITLAEVIAPFDPLEDRCLLMRRHCSDQNPCIAHSHWREVAVRLRGFFRQTTVGDLVEAPEAAELLRATAGGAVGHTEEIS
jgi:Rrf2 family protein